MTNKNDIDYTLLEIIEGPKRLNNLPHVRLFDYLLEATENQDRFEGLLKALEYNAYWAYLGIMIMASDMIPIPKLFEEEFKENITSSYTRGSTNEYGIFNMLISYFERGILSEKKHRVYFTRYMRESLSDDEFKFCETCLKQVYKEEIYPLIKKMYENNKLNKKVYDFFSFTMNHKFDKVDKFTNICLPVNTYKKYIKVGNTIFYNNELLNKKESVPILEFIRVTSLPGRAQIYINYPFVCELYVEDNATEPFMIVTTERAFLTKQPIKFNDIKFIE